MGLKPTEHPEESCATSLQMRFKLIDYFVLRSIRSCLGEASGLSTIALR